MLGQRASQLLRWAGLTVTAALLAALVASGTYAFKWEWHDDQLRPRDIRLVWGRLSLSHNNGGVPVDPGWSARRVLGYGFKLEWSFEDIRWPGPPHSFRTTSIPLWWGVGGVGVPTSLLWVMPIISRRRRQTRLERGQCPSCRYRLGEAAAAGCPECGWNRGSTPAGSLADEGSRE